MICWKKEATQAGGRPTAWHDEVHSRRLLGRFAGPLARAELSRGRQMTIPNDRPSGAAFPIHEIPPGHMFTQCDNLILSLHALILGRGKRCLSSCANLQVPERRGDHAIAMARAVQFDLPGIEQPVHRSVACRLSSTSDGHCASAFSAAKPVRGCNPQAIRTAGAGGQ